MTRTAPQSKRFTHQYSQTLEDMTQTTGRNSTVLWQQVKEGLGEPAILIEAYTDTVSITQEGESVLINYESLDELIKTLRSYARMAKEGKLK